MERLVSRSEHEYSLVWYLLCHELHLGGLLRPPLQIKKNHVIDCRNCLEYAKLQNSDHKLRATLPSETITKIDNHCQKPSLYLFVGRKLAALLNNDMSFRSSAAASLFLYLLNNIESCESKSENVEGGKRCKRRNNVPDSTSPKTVCLPSSQGQGTVVMKN